MRMKEKAAVPTVTLLPAQWDLLVKRIGQKRKEGSGYVRFSPNPVGWSAIGNGDIARLQQFFDGSAESNYCATMDDAVENGLLWILWKDGHEEVQGETALCGKLRERLNAQGMEAPSATVRASSLAAPGRYMLERNTDSEETGVQVEIPITETEIRKMREATLREEIAALHREVRALLGDPS